MRAEKYGQAEADVTSAPDVSYRYLRYYLPANQFRGEKLAPEDDASCRHALVVVHLV